MDKSQGHRGGQRQARIRTPVCLQSLCLSLTPLVWEEGRKFHTRGRKEWKSAGGRAGSPTCAKRSSPFQQQLEAVRLVVESSPVQSAVPISSLGIQVTSVGGRQGGRKGNRQGRRVKVREKKREGGRVVKKRKEQDGGRGG